MFGRDGRPIVFRSFPLCGLESSDLFREDFFPRVPCGGIVILLVLNEGFFERSGRAELVFQIDAHGESDGRRLLLFREGRCFVDDIERLVRQEAIRNMAHGEIDRQIDDVSGEGDVMEVFVAFLDVPEDALGFFERRFGDDDGLEAPIERRVFLEVAFVFGESRRADALDQTLRQGGFQDIGGVETAAGVAGADNSMDFIDEEDYAAVPGRFADYLFEACFEFSAEIGAGDDEREIEQKDAFAEERMRHGAAGDHFGERRDERGLAHARFADEEGIVFLFAGEYLDDAVELAIPADQAVGVVDIGGCHIGRVLIEKGCRVAFRWFILDEEVLGQVEHFGELREIVEVQMRFEGRACLAVAYLERREDPLERLALRFEERVDQMFGTHIGIMELAGEKIRPAQDVFECRGQGDDAGRGQCFAAGFLLQAEFGERLFLEPHIFQEDAAEAGVFEENSQEQVLRLDRAVAGIAGEIPGFLEAMPRVQGEFLAEIGLEHKLILAYTYSIFSGRYCQCTGAAGMASLSGDLFWKLRHDVLQYRRIRLR